jgi:hypothetical protein
LHILQKIVYRRIFRNGFTAAVERHTLLPAVFPPFPPEKPARNQ